MTEPRHPSRSRQSAERRGHWSELIARWWLRLHFYRIEAQRYRTRFGEVDIIARRGSLVIFVEVKARRTPEQALDSVTRTAQHRIQAAGEHWISRHPDSGQLSWRCDVIAICPRRMPVHFRDVW